MTNLKELSVSELHQQIKNATDELINRELEQVKPFRTVKRAAMVGERVVVASKHSSSIHYQNGDIFEVSGVGETGDVYVGIGTLIFYDEYEVIIDDYPDVDKAIESGLLTIEKTNNQQRAELIQRAREFVGDNIYERRELAGLSGNAISHNHMFLELKFIVNVEKRTVVALIIREPSSRVYFRGIAKCHPDEVFNSDIGKAIALARALEIEVPKEFLNAVQPDEVVKGMVLSRRHGVDVFIQNNYPIPLLSTERIINDTNAIYGTSV